MSRRTRKGRARQPREVSLATAMPDRWDMGPDTPAQRAGKVIEAADYVDPETGESKNPNNVRRARRVDMVEVYEKRGILDRRQVRAATILRTTYEATQRTAPAIKAIQVDSSPKPDAHVAIMVDRISKFAGVMSKVLPEYREIIDCVVLGNNIPARIRRFRGPKYQTGIAHMQAALADLADRLDV